MVEQNERLAGGVGPEGAARTYGPVQGPKRDKLIAEAEALVHYVAGHGAVDTNDGAERLKALAEAVEAANAEAHPEPIDARWTQLVVAYERLASVTYAARWRQWADGSGHPRPAGLRWHARVAAVLPEDEEAQLGG